MWVLHGRHGHDRARPARATPRPSEQQVREALAGNLCRCGSHVRVIRAVMRAAAATPEGAEMDTMRISRRELPRRGRGVDRRPRRWTARRAPAQTVAGADRFLGKPLAPDVLDSFLAVHADGSVTIFVGKVDIGTGGRIAMRQLVGEELDVPLERIA